MDESKVIFKCEFGSIVYGTNTPSSDQDFKGIYLPSKQDIILQRAKATIHEDTKKNQDVKNSVDDIDYEIFSLQKYLKLLCESQTVALDILFMPQKHILKPSYQLNFIKKHKDRFLHKEVGAFYNYAKAQAAKYGVKGFRVAAIRLTIEWLKCFDSNKYLFEIGMDGINRHVIETNHVDLIDLKGSNDKIETYFSVCDRKFQLNAKIGYILDSLQKIFNNYGARALQAEKNEGIDWKATSHAVRVAREAEELLLTGNITFPCPEVKLLLAIKKGELPYKQVEELIEEGLARIDAAKLKSTLRDKPDLDFADEIVYNMYEEVIYFS